jgi:hypothetical protein
VINGDHADSVTSDSYWPNLSHSTNITKEWKYNNQYISYLKYGYSVRLFVLGTVRQIVKINYTGVRRFKNVSDITTFFVLDFIHL